MLTLETLYDKLEQMIDRGVNPRTPIIIDVTNDVGTYFSLGQIRVCINAGGVAAEKYQIVISDYEV